MGRGNRNQTLATKENRSATNVEPDRKLGLPRPFAADKKGNKYPVAFSNWSQVYSERAVFSKFDPDSILAFVESGFSICDTCGEPLGKNMIFGLQNTPLLPEETGDTAEATVSGLPMHPKCALIAAAYCPHFKKWNEDNGPIFATVEASSVDFKNQLDMIMSDVPEENYVSSLVSYFSKYHLEDFEGVYMDEIKLLAVEEKE